MSSPAERYNLNGIDMSVLRAIADACYYRLGKHVPEGAILRKCDNGLYSKDIKKSIKKLHAKNLILRHPTGGNMTYQLTKEGQTLALTS